MQKLSLSTKSISKFSSSVAHHKVRKSTRMFAFTLGLSNIWNLLVVAITQGIKSEELVELSWCDHEGTLKM